MEDMENKERLNAKYRNVKRIMKLIGHLTDFMWRVSVTSCLLCLIILLITYTLPKSFPIYKIFNNSLSDIIVFSLLTAFCLDFILGLFVLKERKLAKQMVRSKKKDR